MTAGVALWLAAWWATECIPIPATALIPLALFPTLGILDIKTTAGRFGHPVIFLFLGGFMLAVALEKTGLHRRVALHIVIKTSANAERLLGGFMLAACLISMWVTNTATTLMMVPIAMSIVSIVTSSQEPNANSHTARNFATALMLGLAYASTLGGLATLVGTVPNAVFAAFADNEINRPVDFTSWTAYALPITATLTPITWWVIRKVLPFKGLTLGKNTEKLRQELVALGELSRDEKIVGIVLGLTSIAWVCRPFIDDLFPTKITDTAIAITAALVLFVAPSQSSSHPILTWDTAKTLPWDVLLLFGGGLALAAAIKSSGVSAWIGDCLYFLEGMPPFGVMLMLALVLVSLTELTSNTATVATFLPIVAALADATNIPNLYLLLPVTICASCAFMLPVATPPNTIIFGSGQVKIADMMRVGFWLNLISAIVVCVISYILIPLIFDL